MLKGTKIFPLPIDATGKIFIHPFQRLFQRKSRGYLGPIGDDIPSLIPIVVGLVVFFSAFAFALTEFNARTQSFAADRDSLIIANTLKGSNYISQYSIFDQACQSLRVRGLHYVAGVILNSEWDQVVNAASADPTRLTDLPGHFYQYQNNPQQTFMCALGDNEFNLNLIQNKSYVLLSFPVALELSEAVVPATLVVITWRI